MSCNEENRNYETIATRNSPIQSYISDYHSIPPFYKCSFEKKSRSFPKNQKKQKTKKEKASILLCTFKENDFQNVLIFGISSLKRFQGTHYIYV